MYEIDVEFEKKFIKAQRMKTLKQLEKEYSKEIVGLYRDRLQEQENQAHFEEVVIILY
jgi:hypothetical protein